MNTIKNNSKIGYNVFGGTLNLALSIYLPVIFTEGQKVQNLA